MSIRSRISFPAASSSAWVLPGRWPWTPDILLMDEAFSALDPLIRSGMQDQLLEPAEGAEQDDPVHHP